MTKPAEARTRILDAAEQLFARHGFDATATSLIAKTAAVPKGLLFYYFPAKRDILCSLVGERLGTAAIDAGPLIAPGNPVRSLLNVGEKLFQMQAASEVVRIIVWREEHTHPDVKAMLAAHRRALHSVIEQVLTASVRFPVTAQRLSAAAAAWAAVVTTRPLADRSAGQVQDAAQVQDAEQLQAAEQGQAVSLTARRDELATLAELICSGLQHPQHPGVATA